MFSRQFLPRKRSQAMSSTSSSKLSTPLRATRSVFASKPFLFRSRVDEVSARAALGHTKSATAQASNMLNEKLKSVALPLSL